MTDFNGGKGPGKPVILERHVKKGASNGGLAKANKQKAFDKIKAPALDWNAK